MASHDDLVLIINQLLQGLDKMGDSLAVVKAIQEDVQNINRRVAKLEERVRNELPTKCAMGEMLDAKLIKQLDQIRMVDERLLKIERNISHLSHEFPTKSAMKGMLDEKLIKPLDQIRMMDERLSKVEGSISHLSIGNVERPQMRFDSNVKGRNIQLTNDGMSAERIRPLEDEGDYGGIITSTPLQDEKVFQIRIDETIDRWVDWGMAIGVIEEKTGVVGKHIIGMSSGAYGIASWSHSNSGKSTLHHNGQRTLNAYPLDTRNLKVGSVLGVIRHKDGRIHFHLDGVDMGPAFRNVRRDVYAFVGVMHYGTKISILL